MIEGKICLVTGSTSGIGKEIAVGLTRLGGSVILVGRDKSKCENTAKEISQRIGSDNLPVSYLVADLSSQSSIRNAVQEFEDRYRQLDVLVNNAGIADPNNTPVEQLSLEEWNRKIAVNLTGYFLCAICFIQ